MKLDNTPTRIDSSLDLDAVRTECLEIVKKRAYFSAGASAVPIPLLDVAVDAGMLSQLLPEISYKFGLGELQTDMFNAETREINWKVARERGVAFAGLVASRGVVRMSIQGMGTRIISRQVIKFVPLGGTIIAASMGYFVFKKIATNHVDDCYKTAKGIQLKSSSLA